MSLMTATTTLVAQGRTAARRTSWWLTAAVVALNVTVFLTVTHPVGASAWAVTLLLGALLAFVSPERHLPLVRAVIRGGYLSLALLLIFVFLVPIWFG
jgi:hypothetical protein